MLKFNFDGSEWFDNGSGCFIYTDPCSVELEHSLLSLSKWESKWKKSFLSTVGTQAFKEPQFIDYIRCMEVGDCGEKNWIRNLGMAEYKQIMEYISDERTATTFQNYGPRKFKPEIVTSEIIYYWMASLNIPFEPCESWHLSRLLTLIHVASIKGRTGQKMKTNDVRQMYAEINEKRKRQYNTKG